MARLRHRARAFTISTQSLSNTGTIRSTGGIGLVLTQTNGVPNRSNTNSGAIVGATVGASLYSSSLVNTGTISGATGVLLDANSVISNAAGGTISGSGAAISAANGSYLLSVVNVGTINGNVNLVSANPGYYGSYNNYWAQTGRPQRQSFAGFGRYADHLNFGQRHQRLCRYKWHRQCVQFGPAL
jgi:hypothetical protein